MEFGDFCPELIVSDIDRSSHFYVDIIGFKIEFDRPEELFQYLSFGNTQLMLLQDNENQHSRTGPMNYPRGQGVNFSISAADIAPIAQSLKVNNYPTRIPIRDQWHRQGTVENGQKQLWVMDPDGYLLRFIQNLGVRKIKQ